MSRRGRIIDSSHEAVDAEMEQASSSGVRRRAVEDPAAAPQVIDRPSTPVAPVATAESEEAAAPAPAPAAARVPAAQPGGQGGIARWQAAGQAALAGGAWRLRRLGSAGLVGLGLLVGAAILYTANTLPQGQAVAALKAQLARLAPTAGGGTAAPMPQVPLAALPTRDEAPDVLGRIYQEAQAAGVDLPKGQYEYIPARDGVAAHYRMSFPLHASYPALRTFMDRTLVALPSVAVEGLKIERKNVTDETVDAELRLSAFVRDGG